MNLPVQKSEVSKLSIEKDQVYDLEKTQRSLIDILTREKQDTEHSIVLLKKQVQQLSSLQVVLHPTFLA